MIFESHAHYDDRQFDVDREDLLRVLPSKNVGIVVNVGADMKSSASSVALAQSYDYIYAAVGVHPDEVESMDAACIDRLRQMAQDPRVLAIGEIGLDYFRKEGHACKDTQKYWFRQQLDLAVELEKPFITFQRCSGRYHGDFAGIRKSPPGYQAPGCHSLLFLFAGNGKGIHCHGLLYRDRRCSYL